MGFRVFDAARDEERAEWVRVWTAWPNREVAAHPAYASLFAAPGDRVVCAAWVTEEGGTLFPLLLRPLIREEWTSKSADEWDAVSPYGYGGPFTWGPRDGEEAFWRGFAAWSRDAKLVSTFARLSLFADELLTPTGEVVRIMPNVVRGLEISGEQLWKEYAHKVRKNVNTALRAGLRVEIDEDGRRVSEFLDIYQQTMDRRHAAEGFYFPPSFFEAIIRDLRGHFAFAHVFREQTVVSTELVLLSARRAYSFLGGTIAAAFDIRPNDLLKHALFDWARGRGLREFVLGGGYGQADGIFRYKLAFAPSGQVWFSGARWIHDADRYNALQWQRAAFETAHGKCWAPAPTYFPAYRA